MASDEADASPPGGCGQNHPEDYVVPSAAPLKPAAEEELGECIQRGNAALEQLLDRLVARITVSLRAVNCHPYTSDDVERPVREGLRAALEEQCGEQEPDRQLVETTVLRVRGAVAGHLGGIETPDDRAPADGDGWASERFTPALLGECLQGVPLDGAWPLLRARRAGLQRLVEANFHLVEAIARGFVGRGLEREDLLQEGALALRRAALGYVPVDGQPFGAYARPAIRNRLTDLVRTARGSSAHIARQVARFKMERRRLAHALGRSPTAAEVFAALGWSRTRRTNVERALASGRPHSLELLEEQTGELPMDPSAEEPHARAERQEGLARAQAALERLDAAERQVIQLRHVGPEILTQAETAKRLNLTLHRVRTLESGGMAKLREPFREEIPAAQRARRRASASDGPGPRTAAERSKRS
jgi:RNA polymerase sigma factor (sigma-70 family)